MKHYTTIEQSKKLLELGLPVDSADMTWRKDCDNRYCPIVGLDVSIKHKLFSFRYGYSIPCWSIGALLELIPSCLGKFSDGIDFGLSKAVNNKWYSAHYIKTKENGCMEAISVKTGDTPIDACFEIICWLLENGYIKTEE